MYKKNFAILVLVVLAFSALGQDTLKYPADAIDIRYAISQAVIGYTLKVDTNNLSGFDVECKLTMRPKLFILPWQHIKNMMTDTGDM